MKQILGGFLILFGIFGMPVVINAEALWIRSLILAGLGMAILIGLDLRYSNSERN